MCAAKAAHTKNAQLRFATTQTWHNITKDAKMEVCIFIKIKTRLRDINLLSLCGNNILAHREKFVNIKKQKSRLVASLLLFILIFIYY